MSEDGGGGGARGHRQSERGRKGSGRRGRCCGGKQQGKRGEDRTERKGVSTREKRANFGMRRRSRKNERVREKERDRSVCKTERGVQTEQTGIVPPGQTGETRGGSHAEHYGYVSSTIVFITPSECTRVQITTAAHKSFEVM